MKTKLLLFILSAVLFISSCGPAGTLPAETAQTTHAVTESITIEREEEETAPPKVVSGETKAKYPQLTNLPAIYITLDNGKMSSVGKEIYVPGSYTLVSGDESESIYEQPLTIRGRGNYSWSFEQKPYNLKFDYKAGVLGMGAAKNWILITTYSDKTLLRNYMILNLSVDAGLRGAVEVRFVDVFFNGEYNGLYVLSEKIQIHEERIDIKDGLGTLFEIEMPYRHGDCSKCVITSTGMHLMIDDYKGTEPEYVTEGDKQMLTNQINKAEKAMSDKNTYKDYIDSDSFAKWYVINEFTKNYDSNFTTSCYCYLNEDGKLAMGPPWDYDTCMGNQNSTATGTSPKGFHVADATWYAILLKNSAFLQEVKDMWTAMRDKGIFDDLLASVDNLVDHISESQKLNHSLWPNALKQSDLRGDQSLYTYKEEVEYLRTWMTGRIDWLDEQYYNN
ncbi:MAG: CotH kinase family protein [Eubacteriales bacterium]